MLTPPQGQSGPTWDSTEAAVLERQHAASVTRALPGREAITSLEHVAMGHPAQSVIERISAVRLNNHPQQAIRPGTRADGSRRGRDVFLAADATWRHIS
jgi:hypothetical protein